MKFSNATIYKAILKAAKMHGDDEPDMEVGDLQDALKAAINLIPKDKLPKYLESISELDFLSDAFEEIEEEDAQPKELLIKNYYGRFLRVDINVQVDIDHLVGATVYDNEEDFQKAFCEVNGIEPDPQYDQFIPSLIVTDGKVYIENLNAVFGEPQATSNVADAINGYDI